MANLERLPTELIEMITNYLEYSIDLCSLSQTSRCLYWKTTIEADRHIIQGPEITEIGGNPLDVDEELGRSPLHLAARSGNEFCIRRILAAGYPANPRNEEMEDPVILAAKAGHTETLRLLLENGADPNTTQPISLNGMASNPLLAALSNGHEPAVRLLIDHGARLENNDDDVPVEQPLHAAVRKGNPSLVQLLLEKGCNPMKGLGEPWRWPAALRCDLAAALEHDSGHGVEIILMLVNAGIKPDFSGEDYPHHNRLINALERGDFARFKYLSSHGAELDILPNPADNFSQWDSMPTLFKIAYAPGIHPEEAEWLMALINIDAIIQANKPRQMSNLILGALVGGAESLLRRLLKIEGQPKDPIHQVKDQKDHLTKHLSIAARHGHINIVKLLLDHGADPQGLPDSYVQTPLSAAVERANTEIVKILLDLGAKPRRGDGNKFLYSAISYAHDVKARRKLLLLLVERDLIVQEDTDVRNIIEFAVAAGGESFHLLLEHTAIVETFLNAGFELHIGPNAEYRDLKSLLSSVAKLPNPLEITESMLDLLIQYNKDPQTPASEFLPSVVEIDDTLMSPNAVRLLLKKGSDPFARGTSNNLTPLELLEQYGGKKRQATAQALLDFFDDQDVPFAKVQRAVHQTASRTSDKKLARLWWRWYWPKVHPCTAG